MKIGLCIVLWLISMQVHSAGPNEINTSKLNRNGEFVTQGRDVFGHEYKKVETTTPTENILTTYSDKDKTGEFTRKLVITTKGESNQEEEKYFELVDKKWKLVKKGTKILEALE